MSEIRKELEELTGINKRAKESEPKFLTRLVRAATDNTKVSDDDWDGLSDDAQNWVTDAVEAMNNKEDYPAFPDAEDEEKPKASSKAKTNGKAKPPAKRAAAKKPAAKKPAAKATAKKAKASAKDADDGGASKDKFGLREGSKSSLAADMFEAGAKMADVKSETGTNHYNLLRRLEDDGHEVSKDGAVIFVQHKDAAKKTSKRASK